MPKFYGDNKQTDSLIIVYLGKFSSKKKRQREKWEREAARGERKLCLKNIFDGSSWQCWKVDWRDILVIANLDCTNPNQYCYQLTKIPFIYAIIFIIK